ncbi:MAG: maleylacetoacetate isomerase, partial [Gammaproteobacteria bacterium]|nr:maleylacetoacetate isomerase [Gammaproteobacteria bacterium]
MQLYTYFRSSSAYRVRIALNLKGLEAEHHFVHLLKDGGEQHKPAYQNINPQGRVPVLIDQGLRLTQSLAIIEYLEEIHPRPPLLPDAPEDRARVRALAQAIACEIQPLNNLQVLKYLVDDLKASEEQKLDWYRHWITKGFAALEKMLADDPRTGDFCHQNTPGLADVCLVPQVYNAVRFECDLSEF